MLAPEVFDQRDEDGVVVLLDPEPGEALRATVREAADMCPSGAISVSAISDSATSAGTASTGAPSTGAPSASEGK
jgi:hypothetical protein